MKERYEIILDGTLLDWEGSDLEYDCPEEEILEEMTRIKKWYEDKYPGSEIFVGTISNDSEPHQLSI